MYWSTLKVNSTNDFYLHAFYHKNSQVIQFYSHSALESNSSRFDLQSPPTSILLVLQMDWLVVEWLLFVINVTVVYLV